MRWDQQIFIAELNVQHYQHVLSGNLTLAHRQTVMVLLAEEESTLVRLRAAAAQHDLSQLIELMAQRATRLVDQIWERDPTGLRSRFAAVLERIPCGIGLIDSAGKLLISNVEMLRFLPQEIPSRDLELTRRWRFDTEDGAPNPFIWPGAWALRGHSRHAIYPADEWQQQEVQVATVPVQNGAADVAGAIVAVYDMEKLGNNGAHTQIALILSEEMGQPTDGEP